MKKVIIVSVLFNNIPKDISGLESVFIDNSLPSKNLGFAKAVNIGIKKALQSGAEKVLLVNPDITITKEQILNLGKIGGVSSPVLKFKREGQWVYDFGGKVNWLFGRTTHLEKKDPIASLQDDDGVIDYVSGACMMVDRQVFEKVGFFDESYFMYFEDVDFCLRAKRAGFSVEVNPEIIVEHNLEIHKKSGNRQKMAYLLKSNLVFIWKWIPWPEKILAFLYWILLSIKSTLRMGA